MWYKDTFSIGHLAFGIPQTFFSKPYLGSSDIYQKFTNLIIEKLEQGVIPWKQTWHEMGLPSNYLTRKPYKGINLWLLLSCGHQYPYYLR
ncbi:ArdC-like ssDNA-binding domain-containing protein [Algoriphagus resistens]|uniref:ArdC-like ssDNA-binding domain-containing protein n=1 Tax=Algoriphagus resistens TaxID=1750590 RepID=UPI000716A200|nr:ArdC family protein [Algoriphagus resistens]